MRQTHSLQFYFLNSLVIHIVLVLLLVLGLQFSTPLPVVQNSDKDDKIMNAMILNEPLKINTPDKPSLETPKIQKIKNETKPKPQALPISQQKIKNNQREKLEKQLLADLQKNVLQQKKNKQKALEKAFEKELKSFSEKNIQKQLLDEQKTLSAARAAKVHGVVDKYKALILQAISEQWLIPGNANKKLFCELLIRVAPGGAVLDVQLTKTSGDPALDKSAQSAVFKASPLPVPKETEAFEPFRQFVLRVKPENVISADSWMG